MLNHILWNEWRSNKIWNVKLSLVCLVRTSLPQPTFIQPTFCLFPGSGPITSRVYPLLRVNLTSLFSHWTSISVIFFQRRRPVKITVPKTKGSHIFRATEIQIKDLSHSCTHQKLPKPVPQLESCLVLMVAWSTDCYLGKNQRVVPDKWLKRRISSIQSSRRQTQKESPFITTITTWFWHNFKVLKAI